MVTNRFPLKQRHDPKETEPSVLHFGLTAECLLGNTELVSFRVLHHDPLMASKLVFRHDRRRETNLSIAFGSASTTSR